MAEELKTGVFIRKSHWYTKLWSTNLCTSFFCLYLHPKRLEFMEKAYRYSHGDCPPVSIAVPEQGTLKGRSLS